jgi:hypothetical protein
MRLIAYLLVFFLITLSLEQGPEPDPDYSKQKEWDG